MVTGVSLAEVVLHGDLNLVGTREGGRGRGVDTDVGPGGRLRVRGNPSWRLDLKSGEGLPGSPERVGEEGFPTTDTGLTQSLAEPRMVGLLRTQSDDDLGIRGARVCGVSGCVSSFTTTLTGPGP